MSFSKTLKKRALVLSFGLSAGAAIACTDVGQVFAVTLVAVDIRDIAGDIGGALQAQFGHRYGRDVKASGTVHYTAKLPFGLQGGVNVIPFEKECGKTFQEQANENWPMSASVVGNVGGGGGMCGDGGGMESVVIGYKPIYKTATVSVPGSGGGTTSQQVLVGYEPIYGMMPAQDSIMAVC